MYNIFLFIAVSLGTSVVVNGMEMPSFNTRTRSIPVKPAENPFMWIEKGDIPVIITVPSGGTSKIPGIEERTEPIFESSILDFARDLAHALVEQLGAKPYVVAALFSPRSVNVNKPVGPEAYSFLAAKPFYNGYHSHIARFIEEIKKRFPAGALLIDLHSHSAPGTAHVIYRGTENHKTVEKLIKSHTIEGLLGPKSVLGYLEVTKKYIVLPHVYNDKAPEIAPYDTGYTLQTYGSHVSTGIDALQLTTGSKLIMDESSRRAVAKDVAEAIKLFCATYLNFKSASKNLDHTKTSNKPLPHM